MISRRDIVRRFAKAGSLAIAPALYNRPVPPSAAHDWIVSQSAAAAFYGAVKPVFDEANAVTTPLLGIDDTRASYVASAASNAWQRTLAWFHTYLAT